LHSGKYSIYWHLDIFTSVALFVISPIYLCCLDQEAHTIHTQ